MTPALISDAANYLTRGRLKMGWWGSAYQSADQPVIVGGAPRSGTSLICSILNAHRKLFIGFETWLFCGVSDFKSLAHSTELPEEELRHLHRNSSCLAKYVEHIMHARLTRDGKVRWGEKTPDNVLNLDYIFRVFPRAKFLHVLRDGRDVVCSLRTFSDGRRSPRSREWKECVDVWVGHTRAGLAWRNDARYLAVKYEDLTRDPLPVLRNVFDWLCEPWEPQVLEYYKMRGVRSEITHPGHQGLKRSIHGDSTDRWRVDLPAEAREHFSAEARHLLKELDYASDDRWIRH